MELPRCAETGKVCFNKKDAQTKRNTLKKRGRERNMRVYQCPHCDYWHLTSVKYEQYYGN